MYLTVFGAILSEAYLFYSSSLFYYSLIVFVLFHLFVVFYEEPKLKHKFGEAYMEYCASVPRWGRAETPYDPELNQTGT